MEIRSSTEKDMEVIWAIRREAVLSGCRDFYPAEDLEKWTNGPAPAGLKRMIGETLFLAEEDGEAVGTAMIGVPDGKVDFVFILPNRMGQGIGRMLLQHLDEVARTHGIQKLELMATLNAAPFYRKHGYIGDEQFIYESPRGVSLACVPMTKLLDA